MGIKIALVFDGEYLRDNDGYHLSRGAKDDTVWQNYYWYLIVYPLSICNLLSGSIGESFIKQLNLELLGVMQRK